jgi:hypothetical protein
MQFGKVDINETAPKWETWSWKDFLSFYDSSLKGNVTETPEEIGKALGVKVPKEKLKSGNA